MWEVVGFSFRDSGDRRYYNVYVQREDFTVTGIQCAAINYSASYVPYVPCIGDKIIYSTREHNGRTFVSEVSKVG